MLPSSQRLSRQQVIDLLKNPELQVVFNRTGTLKYLYQSNSGTFNKSGFTVVTGSKQQKKAVLRNKIRRQLYSLFRLYKKNNENKDIMAILYISKQLYDMSYREIQDNFYALLSKTEKNF